MDSYPPSQVWGVRKAQARAVRTIDTWVRRERLGETTEVRVTRTSFLESRRPSQRAGYGEAGVRPSERPHISVTNLDNDVSRTLIHVE